MDIVLLLKALVLGVVEGLTEFLPISSTGHLLLAENSGLLPRQSELFNVVIQAGAVLAVFLVFSRRVKTLLFGLAEPETRAYLGKLAVAFFGEGFVKGSLALIILAIGQFINAATGPVNSLLIMTGKQKLNRNIIINMHIVVFFCLPFTDTFTCIKNILR